MSVLRYRLLLLTLALAMHVGRPCDPSLAFAGEAPAASNAAARSDPPQGRDTKDALAVSTVLLALVVALGLLLLVLTALWGRRMRRQVLKPLPATSARDDLWYLRNRLKSPEDTATEDEDDAP
jgi:hypothetical protein